MHNYPPLVHGTRGVERAFFPGLTGGIVEMGDLVFFFFILA